MAEIIFMEIIFHLGSLFMLIAAHSILLYDYSIIYFCFLLIIHIWICINQDWLNYAKITIFPKSQSSKSTRLFFTHTSCLATVDLLVTHHLSCHLHAKIQSDRAATIRSVA